jgi:hypothetical protein
LTSCITIHRGYICKPSSITYDQGNKLSKFINTSQTSPLTSYHIYPAAATNHYATYLHAPPTYTITAISHTSVELAKDAIITSSSSIKTSSTSSKAHSIWSSIKRHAKEHHEGVNAAFAAHYGQGQGRTIAGKGQGVWEYKRGQYTRK